MNKIDELVRQMTLEEKAALCTGATAWTTTPVERLGIPEMTVSDGPHGLRHTADPNNLLEVSLPATCFPTASCLASSWDVKLVGEVGAAIAEEAIAQKVDVVLGPGANMKRSPLGGRNFEYFSEDPYLAGQMAKALINGLQGKGVGTSLKHFAVNNQEYQRMSINAVVDERTLREIYLAAFETAVKEAQPWTVMCAYNRLNGELCSQHHRLLVEILKEEWGFEGLVVSDWGAVHDRVAALQGGVDLEMPGPRDRRVKAVIAAVQAGTLDEAVLDEAVRRILRIVYKGVETSKGGEFNVEKHHALARRAAAEGMILLKNNGILPLKGHQHIAVIGRAAKEAHFQGGGSSHINPTRVDVPYVELQKLAGEAELSYAQGYEADETSRPMLIEEAAGIARTADVALLYISLPDSKESEGYDRSDLDLTGQQVALIKAVCAVQPNTVVILNNGAPVVMGEWIEGTAAVLEAWMMGQAGGGAIADVLYGRVNPAGRLAESFPARLEDTPAYLNWPGENGEVRYGEGLFIGYRYYDKKQIGVQFPFGYGLSYTTFAYANARVSAESFTDTDGLSVSVDVTNTGSTPGKETVQVYVRDVQASLVRPEKELKGFAKVELAPGETKTATVKLDFRAFAFYHPGYKQWITEDGEFEILVGSSAQDIHCRKTVTLKSTLELPSLLTEESTAREWMNDKRGRVVIQPLYDQIDQQMRAILGGGEAVGLGLNDFLMDMPLVDLLTFIGEAALPAAPEDIVKGMLAQVKAA